MSEAILIAEAGSTSCEWRLIEKGVISSLPATKGFNPTYESTENLTAELSLFNEFQDIAHRVTEVYYYGAGCTAPMLKSKVQAALAEIFSNAEIAIQTDMMGAALAVYRGEPILCGILGTGSNACLFDGREIHFSTPSLGYLIGDEGSGNHIGRLLLRGYFYNEMPEALRAQFSAEYGLELPHVLESIYRRNQPARYLAQFAKFAGEYRNEQYIKALVEQALRAFLTTHIAAFPAYRDHQLGMVGSIAHHFAEKIRGLGEEMGIACGPILQRPIDDLAAYHNKGN